MHKLGIIIPYRHRYNQLQIFKRRVQEYLKDKNIEYEIIVIEQDDGKLFNRGKLLNIGYTYAKALHCDYLIFHDVDMLPYKVDYSYSDIPLHLATDFISKDDTTRTVFDTYFGGVTLFSVKAFELINGFSNSYWGWGFEDDDLLYRCKINNIPLDKKILRMMNSNTAALKFNGHNAFVECHNNLILDKETSIFLTFYPNEITLNHDKYDDEFTIFSIPGENGLDFAITYDSYQKYKFTAYNKDKKVVYVASDIKPTYRTNICITINPHEKVITMYQDGLLVGSTAYEKLLDYRKAKFFYLGCAFPHRGNTSNFFKGLLYTFAVYNSILTEEEILEISENKFFGLAQDFGEYKSSHMLKLYYDSKFVKDYKLMDLAGGNRGYMTECEIVGYTFAEGKVLDIPFRRQSTFELLPHEENGFESGGWKDINTRYNQLKYYNEIAKGYGNSTVDGISNCEFKVHSYVHMENQTHVNVGI
jgi:beta-1,4-galactosyltransferase 1